MNAAVIHDAGATPRAEQFPDPQPQAGEVVARVRAAGLHPLVRGHAAGKHYTSTGTYPLIPGIDGVCELPDGRLAYFGWQRPPYGTFAELAVVAPHTALILPAGLSPDLGAAIINPAMSSWLALKLRARMQTGDRVLVLGATGSSGRLAIQVARAFGASHIIAAGRNAEVLAALGADATLRLDAPEFRDNLTREFAGGIDIVLDYVWGAPAGATFDALLAARNQLVGRRVRYCNIGEMAGPQVTMGAHALRSMNLEIVGSGIGSVQPQEIRPELPQILELAAHGKLTMELELVPLAKIGEAWARGDQGKRIVIVPNA
jgi:NADPH:quinone reductase-like Zn-dependent oxidoreductase